jgi:hypothetical protein
MLTKTISDRTTYSRAKKTNIQSFIPTVENKLWLERQQKATNKTYTQILNESLEAMRLNQSKPPMPDWLKRKMSQTQLPAQDWTDFDSARSEFRKDTQLNLERQND